MRKGLLFLLILLLALPSFGSGLEGEAQESTALSGEEEAIYKVQIGLDGRSLIFLLGGNEAPHSFAASAQGEEGIALSWDPVEEAIYWLFGSVGENWELLSATRQPYYLDDSAPELEPRSYRIASTLREGDVLISSRFSAPLEGVRLEPAGEIVLSTQGDVLQLEWEHAHGAEGYLVYRGEEILTRTQEPSVRIEGALAASEDTYRVTPYYRDEGEDITGISSEAVLPTEMRETALLTRLVNKKHPIEPMDYYPDDLVTVGTNGQLLRREAAEAYERMSEAIRAAGYSMTERHGFRSYETQRDLYAYRVRTNGQAGADAGTARPGHSEHQTGLTIDVLPSGSWSGYSGGFQNTPHYTWLRENAHKYGFVLRYPRGSEHITGYMYEPWHWRYIGLAEATRFYESDFVTLEEFYSIEGGDYLN